MDWERGVGGGLSASSSWVTDRSVCVCVCICVSPVAAVGWGCGCSLVSFVAMLRLVSSG